MSVSRPPHRPPKHVYGPVGACIYCGASGDLSLEHIIASSLGGTYELPKASCRKCADITAGIELKVGRGLYYVMRRHQKFPTSHKHNPVPIYYKFGDRVEVRQLPAEQHPFLVVFLTYPMPTLLTGEAKSIRWKDIAVSGEISVAANSDGAQQVIQAIPDISQETFARMLAKIAHGFAVAELGVGGFTPLLLDVIKRPDAYTPHYVGGIWGDPAPPDEAGTLHEMSLSVEPVGAAVYLTATLRLMAHQRSPIYRVVVGELTSEQATAAARAHSLRIVRR
jgi:hypothetical protein